MSYEPSHRKAPRQERWPTATPQQGWPAYRRADGYRDSDHAHGRQGTHGQRWAAAGSGYGSAAYGDARAGNGYGTTTGGYASAYGGYAETADRSPAAADSFDGAADGFDGSAGGYGSTGNSYAGAVDGYWAAADGFNGAVDGFAGTANGHGTGHGYGGTTDLHADGGISHRWDADGYNSHGSTGPEYGSVGTDYRGAAAEYSRPRNGYGPQDGYAGVRDGLPGSAGYPDHDGYPESRSSGPLLIAPDAVGESRWLADGTERLDREPGGRGLIVGAATGLLAASVAIGVATLAAAFVRPQASPIIAAGGAFIDGTPSALKNFAVERFGENGKTMPLLGMYVTIAVIAMAIGCLARRNVTIAVAGIAALGVFGAFVAITRPESHLTDVIPSVIGGIAGVLAVLWLDRASAPVEPLRHARGSSRRGSR